MIICILIAGRFLFSLPLEYNNEFKQFNHGMCDAFQGVWDMMLLIAANGVLMLVEVVQTVIEVALK